LTLQKTLEKVKTRECIIEVFGLGYVGFPLTVLLASSGFKVVGIDINTERVERLKNNNLIESEELLKEQFLHCRQNGTLKLSAIPEKTDSCKIGIICVPTPIPAKNVQSDIYVKSAAEDFLKTSKKGDIIIIESSIEVGTTDIIQKLIEHKNFKVSEDFGLSFCPERIDPQNKKWKLENIPRVIYSSDDMTFQISQEIYRHINNSNLVRIKSAKAAEVVKSFENSFRLVNISLVNELAILCDKLGISVKDVLNAAGTKPFGFMRFYTSAGAGGHCIPKDPRFLKESANKVGFDFETINSAININYRIPEYIVEQIDKILEKKNLEKSVIVCGLAYKPDMEDMRDSPGFKILSEFQKNNYKISIYDPFFKKELLPKYLVENHLKELDFDILTDLDAQSIKNHNCICLVQHHTKPKFRIEEIYKKSLIPLIYDCQNKLEQNPNSTTFLKTFGN